LRIEKISDGVTLYNADNSDVLSTLGSVDAVVTDPPYGINLTTGIGVTDWRRQRRGEEGQKFGQSQNDWDIETPPEELFNQLREMSVNQIFWGGNYFELPPAKAFLVWDKIQPEDYTASMAEFAWINFGTMAKIFRYNARAAIGNVHPTQKPLRLMEWCLTLLPDPAQLILDPYMGSGTTGVAAVSMGRKFIGIEREPMYFDIACKRISEACKQPALF
jgi:site-specific DNA-methyltransferase (adenine-specific)